MLKEDLSVVVTKLEELGFTREVAESYAPVMNIDFDRLRVNCELLQRMNVPPEMIYGLPVDYEEPNRSWIKSRIFS
jgi:hypothetical protein